jgi:hypothetical protein
MLRLAIIVLVIVVALLRGGSLRNFAAVQLRWLPLVIVGFALQLLIFTPFAGSPLVAFATLPSTCYRWRCWRSGWQPTGVSPAWH